MTFSTASELSESIQDGSFFEESRKFYSEVYISIISERVLYIVLTSFGLLTGLVSLFALLALLPLAPAEPFLFRSTNAVHSLPLISPISKDTAELPDVALRRYLVNQYVSYREGYSRDKIALRARAIFHWSTKDNYEIYRRSIDTSNPRSPVVRYESSAEREIEVINTEIQSRTLGEENAYIAKVDFVAYVIRMGKVEPTLWRADLEFKYIDALVDQDKLDPQTGKMIVEPMKFVVSSYNVREREETPQ